MRFNDEDGEVHEVRGADASDGLRGEPAQRYGVHLQVRKMWTHDEEDAEARPASPPARWKVTSELREADVLRAELRSAARAGVLPGAGALLAGPRRSYCSTANRGGDQGSSERVARWCYSRLAHRLLLHRGRGHWAIATGVFAARAGALSFPYSLRDDRSDHGAPPGV